MKGQKKENLQVKNYNNMLEIHGDINFLIFKVKKFFFLSLFMYIILERLINN